MSKEPDRSVSLTVAELAKRLGCDFEGDGDTVIRGVASLESAEEGDLVFLSHPKFRAALENTAASAAIVPLQEKPGKIPYVRSKTPSLTFVEAIKIFFTPYLPQPGIHETAVVDASAGIGANVSIGANCVIGEGAEIGEGTVLFPHVDIYPRVKVGKDCVLHSQVVVREGCILGDRVILQNGAKIGGDGFGYTQREDGTHVKIPQIGTVVLEDDVEVGANTTIDRAAMDKTIIRKGSKIDNLVMLAHSVDVGENSIIIAQAGVAGSSKIGKNVIIAGQAGVPDHISVGDNAIIGAQCGVYKDVPAGEILLGSPPMKIKEFWRMWASIQKLPQILKDLESLKSQLK